MAEPEDEVLSILLPCTICNRTFKTDSLEKHTKICEKNAAKKRKTFDSSKQRIQGTELAEFLPVIPKKSEKSPVRKSQSTWKEKHMEFVRAIRQARGINEAPGKRNLSSAAAQRRPANHEQCPHCERNFGPKAFDRHIEWCKEQKARIPKSPASILAKERLEARTKYRAPMAKSKRTLTREKYSPVLRGGIREGSPMGSRSSMNCSILSVSSTSSSQTVTIMPSIKTSASRNSGSAPSSQRSSARESLSSPSCGLQRNSSSPSRSLQRNNSSPSCGLQRNTVSRSSTQRRSSSPTKKLSVGKKNSIGGRGESVTVSNSSQKKNSADESLKDIFTSSCNITRINPPGKNHSKSVSSTVPVVTARNKNKKNDVKSNRPPISECPDRTPRHLKQTKYVPKVRGMKKIDVQNIKPAKYPDIRTQYSPGRPVQVDCDAPSGDSSSSHEGSVSSLLDNDMHQLTEVGSDIPINRCPSQGDKCKQQDVAGSKVGNMSLIPRNNKVKGKLSCSRHTESVKLNEVAVNEEQAALIVMPCHIHSSASRLITWQEVAQANVDVTPLAEMFSDIGKPDITNLNITYTVDNAQTTFSQGKNLNDKVFAGGIDLDSHNLLNHEVDIVCCSINTLNFTSDSTDDSFSDSLGDDMTADNGIACDDKENVCESDSNDVSSSDETFVVMTSGAVELVNDLGCGDNAVSDRNEYNDSLRAQDFIELQRSYSTDFEKFHDGLEHSQLYSTPVKSETRPVFVNFEDKLVTTNMKTDEYECLNNKDSPDIEGEMVFEFTTPPGPVPKSWHKRFVKKQKRSSAKCLISCEGKSEIQCESVKQSIFLQGQPLMKRRKLRYVQEESLGEQQLDWARLIGEEEKQSLVAEIQKFELNKQHQACRRMKTVTNFVEVEPERDVPQKTERVVIGNKQSSLKDNLNVCSGLNEKMDDIHLVAVTEKTDNTRSSGDSKELLSYIYLQKNKSFKRGSELVESSSYINLTDEFVREDNFHVISSNISNINYLSGSVKSLKTVSSVNNNDSEIQTNKWNCTNASSEKVICVHKSKENDAMQFRRSRSLSRIKTDLNEVKNRGNKREVLLENEYEIAMESTASLYRTASSPWRHTQPQQPLFPEIDKSCKISVKNERDNDITEPVHCDEAFTQGQRSFNMVRSLVSLQNCDQKSYNIGRYESASLILPDINTGSVERKNKSSSNLCIFENQRMSKKKVEKLNFWTQQAKRSLSPRSTVTKHTTFQPLKKNFSKNPMLKKLPPMMQNFSQQRAKLPRFLKGNFTPSIPNVALILNNSLVPTRDSYDPYVSAERQMMELLSHGDWPEQSEKQKEQESEDQPSQQETQTPTTPSIESVPVSSTNPAPTELRTSPTSAFSKYSSNKPHPEASLPLNSPDSKSAAMTLQSSQIPDISQEFGERLETKKKLNEPNKSSSLILHVEDELSSQDNHVNRRSFGSKISGDSAYSSLNRKSPLADVNSHGLERRSVITDAEHQCLSSSGSESSLPPLCSFQVERHGGKSPLLTSTPPLLLHPLSDQSSSKMSKFCHECGSRYPVTLAKFCCECGVRRLFV